MGGRGSAKLIKVIAKNLKGVEVFERVILSKKGFGFLSKSVSGK